MKIQEIKIHNWRSIRDLSLSCEDLMIFIGQNNHGKSNILSAILFFFGVIGLDDLDFHRDTENLFVEIMFSNLDKHDQIIFKKYVTARQTILVRKTATKEDGFSYHGYIEKPNEDWLCEDNISKYLTRDKADNLPLSHLLPKTGRITKEIFMQAQSQYIQDHLNNLIFKYDLETSPFLGAKNVAKGIFGELFFIPSVKNAENDFSAKGKSIFSDLYGRVINKISETNGQFKEAKDQINSLICILNKKNEDGSDNTLRPSELALFETSLQKELDNWNTKIDVEIDPPDIDEIFRIGATVWIDDGISTDVGRKGQGLQRALIFALVRSLAKISWQEHDEKIKAKEANKEISSRDASKSIYFIFEEPELYLHPQAQRELFDSLINLSQTDNQVFICTHSSSFINLEKYRSICIVRKNTIEEGTTVLQCKEDLFLRDDDKNMFNLTYWINPDRGELFFAKKVVLTEGPTEKTIIPLLAQEIGLVRYDLTIIDCGSKDSIPCYLQLLNKFRIPYVVIYDRDHQSNKNTEAIASADRSSAKIEKSIDKTLGYSVILENDMEEEIGITDQSNKNKPYIALTHIQSKSFVLSNLLNVKIKSIYS